MLHMEPETLKKSKVIVFTCNWSAYSGLEGAGEARLPYSPDVFPLRVTCLGRIHPGLILEAFEQGATGVMLLGCPPDRCHFDFGSKNAEAVFDKTRALLRLLGFSEKQFALHHIVAGDGPGFAETVQRFVSGLSGEEKP